jgi:hypothetical protein
MTGPATMLAILQFVGTESTAACSKIGTILGLEHELEVLKDLRRVVGSLTSDTMVYKVLLDTMETDTDLNGFSPYTHFIERYVIALCSSSYAHRSNAMSQTGWKGSNGRP